jgi:hypothetical protein
MTAGQAGRNEVAMWLMEMALGDSSRFTTPFIPRGAMLKPSRDEFHVYSSTAPSPPGLGFLA